ncbi:MAG: hypothetical protein ACREAK_05925 [Nitrosarchaeum sp.]
MSNENQDHKSFKIDLAYAAILGLTVIITAWCGLQHELWSSTLTFELKEANSAHRQYTVEELKERQLMIFDINLFTSYMEAEKSGNIELADYYKSNFRPEMKVAFDAWIKTDPFNDPEPKTPFTMPEYPNPDNSKAINSFLNLAEEKSQNADRMSTIASNYVFFTTIYAGISFLEGIGRVFPSKKIQTVFLIMGIVMFSVATIILFLTLPIAPFSII